MINENNELIIHSQFGKDVDELKISPVFNQDFAYYIEVKDNSQSYDKYSNIGITLENLIKISNYLNTEIASIK